jgi:quercetin dioxygenase-like cupin family protein
MIIKQDDQITEVRLEDKKVKNVLKRILIGPEDGSHNIIMRLFTVLPGGNTPFHSHDLEHVVKIEEGKGYVVNEEGERIAVESGQSLFIAGGEKHQFRNPNNEPFKFICVILNPK